MNGTPRAPFVATPFAVAAVVLAFAAAHATSPPAPDARADPFRRAAGEAPSGRVLVVGWDGAAWPLLDELVAAGRMPTLAKLLPRSARGTLATFTPTVSPMIWTTIATGVEPEAHGILDFLENRPGGPVPVRSTSRKAPAIWTALSALFRRVDVLGWWATYPVEHVSGVMVSDRVSYQLAELAKDAPEERALLWPEGRRRELLALRADPASVDLSPFVALPPKELARRRRDPDDRVARLATLVASTRTVGAMAERLSEESAALRLVYFEGSDTVGHLFGRERPPALPGVSAGDAHAFARTVDAVYAELDAVLGRLVAKLDPAKDVLILVSDHGFRWGSDRPDLPPTTDRPTAGAWHSPDGVLLAWGRGVRGGAVAAGHVRDVPIALCRLLGLPPPAGTLGRFPEWAFEPGSLPKPRPPLDWKRFLPANEPAARAESAAGDAEAIAKLRALGYLAGAAGPTAPPAGDSPTFAADLNAGTLALERQDPAAAERAFRRAVKSAPGSPLGWTKLGLAQLARGSAEDAVTSLRRAVELSPRGTPPRQPAILGLATALEATGTPKEAIEILDRELAPGGGTPDAAKSRESGISAAPLRARRGRLLAAGGDWERARRDLLAAAAADPKDAPSRNLLAADAARRGEIRTALRLLDESLAIDPGQADVRALRREVSEAAR